MLAKTTDFISTLTDDSESAVSLLILIENRSGQEKLVDAVLPNDRLATVLQAIKQHFGSGWMFVESWQIQQTADHCDRYVPLAA